jgi:23S rRNA (pseudouridine1915-N3)-methyltransferase
MKCDVLALGHKMPKWCLLGCDEYLTRLQRFMKCSLIEIPIATRHKTGLVEQYKEEEGTKILQKISPHDHFVALDVAGQSWSTLKLSEHLSNWQQQGKNLVFAIGGPDGLSDACLKRANQRWSLSALTFPHAMVRVILLEQLYRAASVLVNHPYHREG